ncbi:IS5 family transposase [Candidatus Cyanaurora vandensis]|nr:IS5 family transposase [Candidatus Cyanaurora vandensis]
MDRSDVTDEQWTAIEPLLPKQAQGPGRPRTDDRKTLNGILWVLRSGRSWQDMPLEYGSRITCWRRFKSWSADGTWDRIWAALLHQLDAQSKQDWSRAFLEGNFVPTKKGNAPLRRSRRPNGLD